MKKLPWITVGFTYLLMVWGNLVSATGSGLACPDWPTCHGTFLPALNYGVIFEWGHRLLAFSAGVLIIATLIQIFRSPLPPQSALKRSGWALFYLLIIQILLGGTTVLLGLSIAVSTIHLVVATMVFSGLITVACASTWDPPVVKQSSPKLIRLAYAGLAGFLLQMILGAVVRHSHSGLACPSFPNCLDSFWPFPFVFSTAVAFFHRWWGILLLGLFFHLRAEARKNAPALLNLATWIAALGLAQAGLGIATVLSGIETVLRAVHAALGYGIWAFLFFLAVRAGAVRWLWAKS